jgi:hypothetical protein
MEHSQSRELITSILNIPFESLETLLIQRGIISGHDAENWCEDGINEDHEEQGADTPTGTWPLTPTKPLKRNMPKQRSHNSVTTSGHHDGRMGAFGARQLLNEPNDDNSEEKAVIGYLGEQFV